METPEVHSPHARHRGGLPRWLELLIALTALVTSISSIVIALHHGKTMEKLVQANSLPYMQGGFSNLTPEGKEVLSLDLFNRGVGPAHEQSLKVKVDGRYVTSTEALIAASVGPARAAEALAALRPIMANHVPTRFIPAGQSQFVFRLTRTPQNAWAWDLLDKAQQSRWTSEYCYCSVFHECWKAADWKEPQPVKQCRRDEAQEFVP